MVYKRGASSLGGRPRLAPTSQLTKVGYSPTLILKNIPDLPRVCSLYRYNSSKFTTMSYVRYILILLPVN